MDNSIPPGPPENSLSAPDGSQEGISANIPLGPPEKKWTWRKVVRMLVGAIVLLAIGAYLFVYISLSGGVSNVIRNAKRPPNPSDQKIIDARQKGISEIEAEFKKIEASNGFNSYGRSTHDRCYEGQNNFKVEDGYAHKCTYRITKFYGFNGDFKAKMLQFDRDQDAGEWSAGYDTMEDVLTDYYDQRYGKSFRGSRPYLVSDLPTSGLTFEKNGIILELEFAESGSNPMGAGGLGFSQQVSLDTLFESYDQKDFVDVEQVFSEVISENKYLLLVALQKDYFEN